MFINYRGADSASYGALLYLELSRRFGPERVFLDSESIEAGRDFVAELLARVRGCRVLLAVIGPRWLVAADARGGRLIDDPGDWVRRELAAGLAAGVRVIPVLTDGADLPAEADLPDGISALARCQYRRLRHRDVEADVGRLVGDLVAADMALAAAASRRAGVPRQLPADVSSFTGRTAELAWLDRLLPAAANMQGADGERTWAVVISAVCGTAGVGKTALAVRWAHRVRDSFPDGQLYVNLRGYDPDQPMPAADALARFLRMLGVPGPDIPPELDERAAMYRSVLDGRRTLLVLDNAATVEQVRPLLPGSGSCLVIVTSRDSLAGLVAIQGARRLDLDLLPRPDAVALLRTLIGDRVDAEPATASVLAEQCACLPLALRVAAELAAVRPAVPLAELTAELSDQRRRLRLLDPGGDRQAAVHSVFSWSYRNLSPEGARTFRLLGLHPGPDCDPYAAAALTDTDVGQAQHLLTALTRAHLIQPTRPGQYGMHDLLRAYAAELAGRTGGGDEPRRSLTRLLDHYLATAAAALDILHPAERQYRPRAHGASPPTPPVAEPAAALAWLDAQRAALVAASGHAAAHGWPAHAVDLAFTLFRYLDFGGHLTEALTIQTHALDAARQLGNRSAEAQALSNVGGILWRLGSYRSAIEHLELALPVLRRAGDRLGAGRVLVNLGVVHWRQGRYQQATDYSEQALATYREIGDQPGEARALGNLGLICWRLRKYDQAIGYNQQALRRYRDTDDLRGQGRALGNLGNIYRTQGRHNLAATHHRQALALYQRAGDRIGIADAMTNLALVHTAQGDYQEATDLLQQALASARTTGDHAGETHALNSLGETAHAAGRPEQARAHHRDALSVAQHIDDPYEQARAYHGLARAHQATGHHKDADHHWQQALTRYRGLGLPGTDD